MSSSDSFKSLSKEESLFLKMKYPSIYEDIMRVAKYAQESAQSYDDDQSDDEEYHKIIYPFQANKKYLSKKYLNKKKSHDNAITLQMDNIVDCGKDGKDLLNIILAYLIGNQNFNDGSPTWMVDSSELFIQDMKDHDEKEMDELKHNDLLLKGPPRNNVIKNGDTGATRTNNQQVYLIQNHHGLRTQRGEGKGEREGKESKWDHHHNNESGWTCQRCTFIVNLATPICPTCQFVRINQWSCGQCTLINVNRVDCSLCQWKNPELMIEKFKAIRDKKTNHWTCPLCMVDNLPNSTSCLGCKVGPDLIVIEPMIISNMSTNPGYETKREDGPGAAPEVLSSHHWLCKICLLDNLSKSTSCIGCQTNDSSLINAENAEMEMDTQSMSLSSHTKNANIEGSSWNTIHINDEDPGWYAN